MSKTLVTRNKAKSLNRLIESCSKFERSYLKKYLTRFKSEETGSSSKLFNELCKNSYISDKFIAKKLALSPSKLANTKFYLYKTIIAGLRDFHKKDNINNQILDSLSDAAILFNKSLFDEAEKLIIKLKAFCTLHQEFNYLVQAINLEISIRQYTASNETKYLEMKEKLLLEQIEYQKILINITEYQLLKKKYQEIRRSFPNNSKELENEIAQLVSNPLLTFNDAAKSTIARMHYYQLNYAIHNASDARKAAEYSQGLIDALENELGQEYIKGHLTLYIESYGNLLAALANMNDKVGFKKCLAKMDLITKEYDKFTTEESLTHLFRKKTLIVAEKFHLVDFADEFIRMSDNIESGIKIYKDKIRTNIICAIYQGLGNACFYQRSFDKAISWYNYALILPKAEVASSQTVYGSIMNLIMHVETDYLHVESIYNSTTYAVKDLVKEDTIEHLLLKAIKKIINVNSDALTKKKAKIDALNSVEKLNIQKGRYPHYIKWLEG